MMKNTARTIQIFLPDGDPSGIRIAELTTSILRVVDIPRTQLKTFFSTPEASQVGIYFLLGDNEEYDEKLVYIGQSQDLQSRLTQHNGKEFWNRAIVVLSLTNNLTQTHALYLEWLAIKKAKHADRFKLENNNAGSKPYTPDPLAADCDVLFELMDILISTLDCPIFKPLVEQQSTTTEKFYCTRRNADARGILTDEGFVVLKGSTCNEQVSTSISDVRQGTIESQRNKLLQAGVISLENKRLIFLKDHLFNTPSGASSTVIGHSSNGWKDWKTNTGDTLHDVKRIV